jgi:hypothetical protein
MASIGKEPDGRYQARWRTGPQKNRPFDRKGDADLGRQPLRAIFKAAVGDRLIAASPCIQIALPTKLDTQ